ncbi:MAG: threonine--tRNA ligase [Clostridiales bacterium]|jgi:threonyl-tRNA synthetase|nr:threonine--tRNA ligase [Clostridiales bacterium]MDR2751129.1 threonine--tRNA ligase [Clostridiales bacterium]
MIKIALRDSFKEVEEGTKLSDLAAQISRGLAQAACCALVDGETKDLREPLVKDCKVEFLTFDDPLGKRAYRHTASHVLAQAAKRLFPDVLLAIGPATDDGFYYDFDHGQSFTKEEIEAIEAEMKKIIKEDIPLERYELSREDALAWAREKGEPYKEELITLLPESAVISFYKQGDFTDLCAGPHLASTKGIKAVKLFAEGGSSGAYWQKNEKNKMLSRIYGTAFPKQLDLDNYLKAREEARKRDHNRLGRELKLFATSDIIGQGLPLLMPKGARVIQLLQRFVEDEEERRGYVLTKTPFMAKSDLYKLSGHWDHYKDGMFVLGDEKKDDEVFALRPMTCPFQFEIYKAEQHSYRDLPIRYAETSTLFRNESSGEMHGLIRVRQFTISEGHLVCTRDQLKDEFKGCVDLIKFMTSTLGLQDDISFRFSKWDPKNREKYIGDEAVWEDAQGAMREIIDELGLDVKEEEGEAAFYGPKLDIQAKNVFGKEDTIITVQIDFALAEKFKMNYIDKDGSKKAPIVIHRTSIGCYERTLALLVEKYAGAFPVWLAPVQARVLAISDKSNSYATEVCSMLKAAGLRAEADTRAEKVGFKMRESRLEKVPYLLVVGEKEAESGTVALWSRAAGEEGPVATLDFIKRAKEEVEKRVLGMEKETIQV